MSSTPDAMEKMHGCPGRTIWARHTPHSTVAHSSTSVPASVTGVVPPGWESTSRYTGIPYRAHSMISSTRISGCTSGLIRQVTIEKFGVSRTCSVLPRMTAAISTWSLMDCAPMPWE